ncbi:unnamed protein product, partial [Staurois parvus]
DDLCSPSSATCQCPSVPAVSAHPCHLPVPYISAHLSCLSESPISASQPPATCQCCQSVPPNSASQCRLSVPYMSAAFQCPSVMPVNAHQCHISVPI